MSLRQFLSNAGEGIRQSLKRLAPATGRIDLIDAEGFICGWAFAGSSEPAQISVTYKGLTVGVFTADLYRQDLKVAGMGTGRHAFRLLLPDEPERFDPDALEIRLSNGKLLERSDLLRKWRAVDLLSSQVTPVVQLELTSRCNLRCVYCAVSQLEYQGEDFSVDELAALIEQMKERGVRSLAINGHGETTYIPDWEKITQSFAEAGFQLSITSNLARLLKPDELNALARIPFINVSIDTHDADLLRKIRRKVDVENIMANIENIREEARRRNLPEPEFNWNCVLSDLVALKVLDFVKFGLSHGVKNFTFLNLVEYPTPPGTIAVRNIAALNPQDLAKFREILAQSERLIHGSGGQFQILGDLAEIIANGGDAVEHTP